MTAGLSLPNWESTSCGDNCGFYYIMLWYAASSDGNNGGGQGRQTFILLHSQIINSLNPSALKYNKI